LLNHEREEHDRTKSYLRIEIDQHSETKDTLKLAEEEIQVLKQKLQESERKIVAIERSRMQLQIELTQLTSQRKGTVDVPEQKNTDVSSNGSEVREPEVTNDEAPPEGPPLDDEPPPDAPPMDITEPSSGDLNQETTKGEDDKSRDDLLNAIRKGPALKKTAQSEHTTPIKQGDPHQALMEAIRSRGANTSLKKASDRKLAEKPVEPPKPLFEGKTDVEKTKSTTKFTNADQSRSSGTKKEGIVSSSNGNTERMSAKGQRSS